MIISDSGVHPQLHYLLFYNLVPDYLEKRSAYRAAHLEHARKAEERGELVLAGALSEPADQAVLIFSGEEPGAAEKFAEDDPYVLNGLVKNWKVRKWMTVLGEGSSPP